MGVVSNGSVKWVSNGCQMVNILGVIIFEVSNEV
jgi:hypothetical protein